MNRVIGRSGLGLLGLAIVAIVLFVVAASVAVGVDHQLAPVKEALAQVP